MSLTLEKYDKKKLVIKGDKKYDKLIRSLGEVRWNGSLKNNGGSGWTVPIEKEGDVKKLISVLNKEEELDSLKSKAKSRKSQKKYHRAVSDTEEDPEEEPEEDESEKSSDSEKGSSDSEKSSEDRKKPVPKKFQNSPHPLAKKPLEKKRVENSRKPSRDKDLEEYYRSFAKSPKSNQSSSGREEDFSNSSSDSDSDHQRISPVRRLSSKKNYKDVANKVRELEKRLYRLEKS